MRPQFPDRYVIRRGDGMRQIVGTRIPVLAMPQRPADRIVYVDMNGRERVRWFCVGVIAMGLFVIAVAGVYSLVRGA